MRAPQAKKAHRGIETTVPDGRKQSYWMPLEIVNEARAEAERRGITLSKVMQEAWKIASETFSRLPTVEHPTRRRAA